MLEQSNAGDWQPKTVPPRTVDGTEYRIKFDRPRTEGLFARIERWTSRENGETHWRTITNDNVASLYGKDNNSRIFDPDDPDPQHPTRIFSWLICQSFDDRGNAIEYTYKPEDSVGLDTAAANERNRDDRVRSVNRYVKSIKYGNRVSRLAPPDSAHAGWLFEVVFDYGEHDDAAPAARATPAIGCAGGDPFSSYRAGFETRTYRLCQRILMFHHFPAEAAIGNDCLVRSTDFHLSQSRRPAGRREDRRSDRVLSSPQSHSADTYVSL